MNRLFLLPALVALFGVAACDAPASAGSTAFAVAVDARLGPVAAAPARASSIYAIVPD